MRADGVHNRRSMGKFLAVAFLGCALPALGDDLTKLEIHVTNQVGHRSITPAWWSSSSTAAQGEVRREDPQRVGSQNQPGRRDQDSADSQGLDSDSIRADHYQTFGQTFSVQEDEKLVEIKLNPPQSQYSAHDKDKDK